MFGVGLEKGCYFCFWVCHFLLLEFNGNSFQVLRLLYLKFKDDFIGLGREVTECPWLMFHGGKVPLIYAYFLGGNVLSFVRGD